MVVVRVKGGLGNQLFQYATGYAVARKNEHRAVCRKKLLSYAKTARF